MAIIGTLVFLKDLSMLNSFLEDVQLSTASLTRYRVGRKSNSCAGLSTLKVHSDRPWRRTDFNDCVHTVRGAALKIKFCGYFPRGAAPRPV